MTKPDLITVTLDRRILEHPEAVHVHRIRAAIWLYLVLLARTDQEDSTLQVDPPKLARSMGLKEGTIRSWIGRLRKGRYLDARRTNGTIQVRLRRTQSASVGPTPAPKDGSEVIAKRIAQALGEDSDPETLREVARKYPALAIRKALAATLAVPSERIRRSRTALFLYLIKRHEEAKTDDPRD